MNAILRCLDLNVSHQDDYLYANTLGLEVEDAKFNQKT